MSEKPGGEIVIYPRAGVAAIEVRLEGETVWLSQQQLAELLQTSRTNIVEHIQNIYAEGELVEVRTCRNIRQVRTEGAREVARTIPFYNLDVIISLGYRVHSGIATQFRIWATERLREYLVKGFTMDFGDGGQNAGRLWLCQPPTSNYQSRNRICEVQRTACRSALRGGSGVFGKR